MHYSLPQLIALDERYPTQRKLLLVPSINFGRELLASLALERGSWIGWEVATLATLADKMSMIALAERETRRGSDVVIADLVGRAYQHAATRPGFSPVLAELAWSAGTRGAIVDAILELRSGGATAEMLRALGNAGVVPSLATILERYEKLLKEHRVADSAEVFRTATVAFDDEKAFQLDHRLMVSVPSWTVQGLSRGFFEKLVAHGLQALAAPISARVSGDRNGDRNGDSMVRGPVPVPVPAPEFLAETLASPVHASLDAFAPTSGKTMFCAVTPADELREVLRRALAAGARLDEIEIAATDRDVYGAAMDALCSHLSVNCTMLDGLPLQFTRIGRAVERWFTWIESDYQASVLRDALESGDWQFTLDATKVVGTSLAAELRRLRVGWGLDATRRAARFLASPAGRAVRPRSDDEPADELAARHSARDRLTTALSALLGFLITLAPGTDDDTQTDLNFAGGETAIAVSELAQRTTQLLALIEPHGPAERATLQRVAERLAEVAGIAGEPTTVANAVAALRQDLGGLRAWTNSSSTARPRRATGGHIHLTNIESAGATGRPYLFIVGLDADRASGPVLQSPLLPDWVRVRLNERGAGLPTIEQRRQERAWALAVALNATDANVGLSYALRGDAGGRESPPAPMLLEEGRRMSGDPSFNYDKLRETLGQPASAVPAPPGVPVDERDVVLSHMTDGALLLDANSLIQALKPSLGRGLLARDARASEEAGPFHGLVPEAGVMDPRVSERAISPSALENIAACSMRWFYSHALNARVPDEPEFDPMVWLNVLDRGTALHTIYERIVREQLHEQPRNADRAQRVASIVQDVAQEWSLRIPSPGNAVYRREVDALLREAQLFVNSEHEAYTREPWTVVDVEIAFGDDAGRDATLTLDDGSVLRVHGRVDRVDRLQDGTLRLVDYKTSRSFTLDTKRGAFDGGRKLQLAVYSPAISSMFDAAVSAAVYSFPTKRGNAVVARADRELLELAPRVVRSLLDDVAAGRFIATVDVNDCKYCDYASICRVTRTRHDKVESPRAEWSKAQMQTSAHHAGIRARLVRAGDSA
ncbi:MAG: PD-(D/E)XK nuclease family protein [Gemmatimonas sp.]